MNFRSMARLVWLLLVASVVLYVIVAYGVRTAPAALPADVLIKAMYVVALILFVSSVLIHRRLLAPEMVRKYASESLLRHGVAPDSQQGRALLKASAEQWVMKVCIVSWAVAEAVAVLGLAAALITSRPANILPFAVVTLLILVWLRPDFAVVDRIAPGRDPY